MFVNRIYQYKNKLQPWSMCQVFTSDANGVCQFTLPAKAYEIHTLKIPAGYAGDTATITQAPANGGELSFTLTKN